MFGIGDLVVYGVRGVCRIKAIITLDWNRTDPDREYYELEPLYGGDMIYIPTDNEKVYMRHVMSKEEILDLIDSMPDIESESFKARSIQQLSRYYQAAIDSHDSADLVRLTKYIYLKKKASDEKNKQLGQVDMKYMAHAEDLLFGEIAAVLDIPRDEVLDYIGKRIRNKG